MPVIEHDVVVANSFRKVINKYLQSGELIRRPTTLGVEYLTDRGTVFARENRLTGALVVLGTEVAGPGHDE